jgi:hypothetical protein
MKYLHLLALTGVLGVSVSGAPLFTSNFDYSGSGPWQLNVAPASVLDGWTVSTASVDWIGTGWTDAGARTNPSLSGSIDLNGLGPGGLSRTLTGLTPGATYAVSFYLAGNPFNGSSWPAIQNGTLTFGSATQALSFNTTGRTATSMGWIPVTYSFTASGSTQTVSFTSNDAPGDPNGLAIDGVSVSFLNGPPPPPPPSGIPEPATTAMMGGGLAVLALMRRSRR